jgi:hypothetical protein
MNEHGNDSLSKMDKAYKSCMKIMWRLVVFLLCVWAVVYVGTKIVTLLQG